MSDGVVDARSAWDQMLDQSPPEFARVARHVGDAVAVASSILHQEVGCATPDAAVALAALLLERMPSPGDE
jgi:hypothetical protein